MTEPNQGGVEYTEERARQGIGLIAQNADMLEQTATNLKAALALMSLKKQQEALGVRIERATPGAPYNLTVGGSPVPGRSSISLEHVETMARAAVQPIIDRVVERLESVGRLAHEVHLDHRELGDLEKSRLATLPDALEQAKALLETFVRETQATPELKEQLIQARRDATFLGQLAADLTHGNKGEQVATYNEKLVDRQAGLLTRVEIEADKSAKWEAGMKMLADSDRKAQQFNPSYRDKVSKRKSLDVVDDNARKTTPNR
jgi:hypothetical protein